MKELKVKVGDKVYDSVNFPDMEGKVTDILNDNGHSYSIVVLFYDNEYSYTKFGQIVKQRRPTLSLEPYEVNLNVVTEKQETFEYGDKVMYNRRFNGEAIFIRYGMQVNVAVICYKSGVTDVVLIKDLVKV